MIPNDISGAWSNALVRRWANPCELMILRLKDNELFIDVYIARFYLHFIQLLVIRQWMFSQFLFLAKLSSLCEIYQWTEIRSAFMRYTFSKLRKEQIKVMMVASFVVLSRSAPSEMHWCHLTCARTLSGSSLSDSYLQVIAIYKFWRPGS